MIAALPLIQLGISFLSTLIDSFTKSNVPQEVIDALNAALVAVQAHAADLISKADLESQRG